MLGDRVWTHISARDCFKRLLTRHVSITTARIASLALATAVAATAAIAATVGVAAVGIRATASDMANLTALIFLVSSVPHNKESASYLITLL